MITLKVYEFFFRLVKREFEISSSVFQIDTKLKRALRKGYPIFPN